MGLNVSCVCWIVKMEDWKSVGLLSPKGLVSRRIEGGKLEKWKNGRMERLERYRTDLSPEGLVSRPAWMYKMERWKNGKIGKWISKPGRIGKPRSEWKGWKCSDC